jgi:L-idonate 5-dehydrogenase
MHAVVIHGPNDLRVERREPGPLGEGEVRVRLGAGGICGTDLHYWHEGGIGDFPVREPLVLGHEMAGIVIELGAGVTGPAVGTKVAVDPTTVPDDCPFTARGEGHLSPRVRFAGSSRVYPHVQGFFVEQVAVPARQLHPLPADMPLEVAAMAEPLAVCLHAVGRAAPLLGRKVLITGAGPIGCLMVVAARLAGAGEVIVTDLVDSCLAAARQVGADTVVNVAKDRSALDALQAGPGEADVVIECAGARAAVVDGLKAARRGGSFVQLGILPKGEHPIPIDVVITKEIDLHGSFRFTPEEFGRSVRTLASGRVDVRPLLTAQMPLAEAPAAFALAADRQRAMKVHLTAA